MPGGSACEAVEVEQGSDDDGVMLLVCGLLLGEWPVSALDVVKMGVNSGMTATFLGEGFVCVAQDSAKVVRLRKANNTVLQGCLPFGGIVTAGKGLEADEINSFG